MRAIYVDVDDTLIRTFGSKRLPITRTVELVRQLHAAGAELYCWSRGGGAYACAVAKELGLEHCFRAYLPKPGLLIDDADFAGWEVEQLHPNEAASRTIGKLLEPQGTSVAR